MHYVEPSHRFRVECDDPFLVCVLGRRVFSSRLVIKEQELRRLYRLRLLDGSDGWVRSVNHAWRLHELLVRLRVRVQRVVAVILFEHHEPVCGKLILVQTTYVANNLSENEHLVWCCCCPEGGESISHHECS